MQTCKIRPQPIKANKGILKSKETLFLIGLIKGLSELETLFEIVNRNHLKQTSPAPLVIQKKERTQFNHFKQRQSFKKIRGRGVTTAKNQ